MLVILEMMPINTVCDHGNHILRIGIGGLIEWVILPSIFLPGWSDFID